ncbi:dTDP-4-dehydrorhamnose 3,5-epimerase [Sulfuricella denitrificans skB26]|uniref:dTDP-4-dehydrorhamnose 3,5-epimerase n=1 Tax=Sulfuricella denitrificans (strain DSM 22764 / NBRC 105220 / skB26) TaxID=1163617 RepID=S6AH73_SULDS|nr:dTDP-4-dehydrorhamnose 3,5-epimerase [Sulfuricella denitrificans]BAN35476.1 dTDP-4-dehydrorhamnose 3,5-epimerase [Sulfuricella denitrificans skB26]
MQRFDFIPTPLVGLMVVQRKVIEDYRGLLSRLYCVEEFCAAGINKPIAQINHTITHNKGAVRGLHFQHPPHTETKLVSCLTGAIWDVAVDFRRNSPTFLQWHGETLSAENRKSLFIPEGFAHGFQTLTEDCELIYLHTAAYRPDAEGALNVADPRLNITWPLPIDDLSERDRNHSFIGLDSQGIVL